MNPYAPPEAPSAGPGAQAAVPVPGLEERVFVRQRTFWGKPGFVVDGAFRPTVRGVLELPDAEGRVRRLSLRGFPLDPCPRVVVDGVVVDAFPRLPWWAAQLQLTRGDTELARCERDEPRAHRLVEHCSHGGHGRGLDDEGAVEFGIAQLDVDGVAPREVSLLAHRMWSQLHHERRSARGQGHSADGEVPVVWLVG